MISLYAYLHTAEKSGNIHLRVKQSRFDDILKEKMSHVGSPAKWDQSKWEWDYPLTAAAVVALYRVSDETGYPIEFAPDLVEFAQQQKKIEDYEKAVRLAIEKTIRGTDPLPGYVTNTFNGQKNPLRHQQIAYHWGVRVSGLLLAHDPGCISGSAFISIKGTGGHSQYISLAELARVWGRSEVIGAVVRTPSVYPDGQVRYNIIRDVLYRGSKKCLTLIFAGGPKLICTPDHEILTTSGWMPASKLREGAVITSVGTHLSFGAAILSEIKDGGEKDVYDLVMEDPARNFVANGVVVHNCGKSRSGIDISRGWYDAGVIRPMQQVWIPSEGRWGVRGGILVICPNNMQSTWKEEFNQWQGMTALEITGTKAKKTQKAGTLAHAHIINYESLRIVLLNAYDAVIIDESHRCANYSGQTTNCLALAQKALRRVLLTGTPVSNSLESVFYQMLIVDGGRSLGASKTAFLDKWFDSEMGEGGRPQRRPKPGAVEAVSELMSRSTYFLRKEEALDLPEKLHSVIKVEMTADQERYYNNLKAEVVTYIQDSEVTVEQAAARMMKLRQVCQGFVYDDEKAVKEFSSAKIDTLIDLLQNSLAGRKVVVWACFTPEIDRMVKELYQRGIGYVRMDGKITKQHRDEAKHRWNTDPSITVLIGQIQMGIGLTLHANECEVPCYDCIYLGIDWSYVNWIQSQDRIHRIGQKYKCNYLYLLSEGGVDTRIYNALQTKAQTSDAVYKTGKEFFRSLIMDDTPNLAAID